MIACATCTYSDQAPVDPNNIGADRPVLCLRYPPVPYPIPAPGGRMQVICVVPTVSESGTCGEWTSRDLL